MTLTYGFQKEKEQTIHELQSHVILFRHQKTGAELMSVLNDDENKVFGITFRTPPTDSTGIAHILEHSVLCGSRKYPVKEPFVELLKGSLQTFLNAFTYPDKTCYPVASQNLQDFYNLIDVYLDAVFYPRITPFVFQQEGWHVELNDPNHPLSIRGVVYNEMKGAYSSPDNVLTERSLQSLFPENAYRHDSGGNPKNIPDLNFDQFLAFHQKYYHPSNARIYFYGDDDPEERLKLVNVYLKAFDPMPLDSMIRLQSVFQEPKRETHPFMAGSDNSVPQKGMVTLNWLLPDTSDPQINYAMRILNFILLGMPASPLRKALIDSGLGDDIAGEGLGNELRQMYFSTGLKGVEKKNEKQVETLILETLKTLSQKGIDALTIEAALNTIEFRLWENNTGRFPSGLSLMLRTLTTWLYESDPFSLLAFNAPLEKIKIQIKTNRHFFEEMISRSFVNNPHRTTLILEPDTGLSERQETEEKEKLLRLKSGMNADQLAECIENTIKLRTLQEKPDSPVDLATIPFLKLTDLDKKNKQIPMVHLNRHRIPVLFHELSTNGIAYVDIGFNIHTLPERYLSYVPLFGRALIEMGTIDEDFVALTQRIRRKTGGIAPQIFTSTAFDSKKTAAWLFLRGKVMGIRAEDLINIFRDLLISVKLDNRERFRQMVSEELARTEQKVIPGGHQMVNLRLQSHFSEAHWAAEQMEGISYLFFLRKLSALVKNNWPMLLDTLKEIHRILLNRNTMLLNITLDSKNRNLFEPFLDPFLESLPESRASEETWTHPMLNPFEGMKIPSQVNYVGKGANLYDMGYKFHGSALVITRYLRNSWLWDQIRVKGGAYGAFCFFDRSSGTLSFISYRDPHMLNTLEVFDQTSTFLGNIPLEESELNKGIIGTIGDLDAHMLPDAKGYLSLIRHLVGDTEERRLKLREQIFMTKKNDYKTFASMLEKVKKSGIVKVMGSPTNIDAIEANRPGWLTPLNVL